MEVFLFVLTLFAAVIGGLIASIPPIVTAWMNSKKENRIALLKCATDAAIEDFRISTPIAENNGEAMYPMSSYIYYHTKFLELAENNSLCEQTLTALLKERDRILKIYKEVPVDEFRFFPRPAKVDLKGNINDKNLFEFSYMFLKNASGKRS